jgi:hypothetical protein
MRFNKVKLRLSLCVKKKSLKRKKKRKTLARLTRKQSSKWLNPVKTPFFLAQVQTQRT